MCWLWCGCQLLLLLLLLLLVAPVLPLMVCMSQQGPSAHPGGGQLSERCTAHTCPAVLQ
jgi:hypothetical protein